MDRGTAIIEFVLLGIVVLVPLMYLVLAVSVVQRNLYGVTHAAREAGRAYATGTSENAAERASYAARLAMEDQGLSTDGVTVRYGSADADCAAASTESWPLTPGAEFAICVTRTITVPAVPGVLLGSRNSVTGRYLVHLDDFRSYQVR
jgi:Flp pilus assembly protein TadG